MVRCLIYYKDNEIHTSSRGAINYNLAIKHIIKHPKLIDFFEKHPSIILDGEIYKFGWTLNKISGLCRLQEENPETNQLELYWYDIYDTNNPDFSFEMRFEMMEDFAAELGLSLDFNPESEWEENALKIRLLPQKLMSGWAICKKYHDEYVKEGWEGLVIRKIDAPYGPGKRSNDMIKIKMYNEDTFKCIGIEQGLRKYDDMVFIMETKDKKQFKAKPMGDLNQKIEYTNNFDQLYKNHLGDVKFFEYSPYGIPEQPCFIAFRFDLE